MIITGRHLAGAIFTLATFLAACGEDSPGTSIDAPKTIDSPEGIDAPIDASIDAPPGDGGFSGACLTATCYALEPGTSPTPITTHDKTEDAPTLTGIGGASLDGDYTLTAADVYTKGTFSDTFVSGATVSDNGGSNGTARFADDFWGYYLNFDIHYDLASIAGAQEGDAVQTLRGGGCFSLSGAALSTEVGHCDEGWPDGATPPSDYEIQYDDTSGLAKVKITLSKAFVLSLLPPDSQTIGDLAITGPLVFLLSFQKDAI
jgi:hypothetical protein